jgi:glycosyltransferase involved in cell wall biosynthesis
VNVCIVGGIFDKPASYRRYHRETPETILAEGLAARGVDVRTAGHGSFEPRRGEIVHVHHIGRGALVAVASREVAAVAVTPHDGRLIERGALLSWRARAAWRITARWADGVVVLSERERLAHAALIESHRLVTIGNGIPFVDAGAPLPVARPYVLYVGQLIPLKGVDHLLRAFARMAADFSGHDVKLAYHNAQEEAALRSLARDLGIAPRVHFLGALNPDQLRAVYRDADCLVLPSLAEALPSVLIEAQLQGCPAVATRVGGIPEIVEPDALVPPADADALAAAMSASLRDPDRRSERQRRARRDRMQAQFGVDRMIDAHLALYQRLPAMRRSVRARGVLRRVVRWVLPPRDTRSTARSEGAA